MIFGRIKNISIVVVLNMLASYPVLASDRLTGLDIKEQAVSYFMQQGLNINLLVFKFIKVKDIKSIYFFN